MNLIQEIAFTCYAVTDMERSRAFYEGVLGLVPTMVKETVGGKWVEYEIGPGTFSLGQSPLFPPSKTGASIAFEMTDFDLAIARLKEAGVTFRMGPLETPVCHMAMVEDPDGSMVCIHKRKPGHN